MGWLRDLMISSTPPIRSFGALSRAALLEADWPAESKIQLRSLATLFSKLDNGRELDWLAERTDVQAALAKLLKCGVQEISIQLHARPSDRPTHRARWTDLRYARPLDLESERLPPG